MTYGNDGASHPVPASLSDRLPPQNVEAERGVIGSMLQDRNAAESVLLLVKADDFYRDSHQIIFRALADLLEYGGNVDGLLLADELTRRNQLARVGGTEALAEIQNSVPHAANAAYYAQIVHQKSIMRAMIELHNAGLRACYEQSATAADILTATEEGFFALADTGRSHDVTNLETIVDGSFGAMDQRLAGEVLGIGSGFPELDSLTGGFQNATLTILAARPSQGKSALALSFADAVATDKCVCTLFISLEMNARQLGDRYLAMRGRVDGARIANPEALRREDSDRLANAAEASRRSRLLIDDTPGRSIADIAAIARRAKARHGLGIVLIDYLQLIDGPRLKGEPRHEEVARISRRLKQLARDLAVPVVVLSQLNRQSEAREDRRPRMADLRESGQIEQDADLVLLLHRPEVFDPNDRPGRAELIVAKNRCGPTGTVSLGFDRWQTRFYSPGSETGGEPITEAVF